MEGMKAIPVIVLLIGISGIISGAVAITLGKFSDTTTDTDALAAISNASAANGDVAEQLTTLAIIGVMVVIITMIASVLVYMRYFA